MMNTRKQQPHNKKPLFVGFVATSIDGRISLSKTHPPDWTSKEDWRFFQKELSACDAVIVGRHTYEGVAARLKKRNTFVFTRSKKLRREGTVTFLDPERTDLRKLLAPYKRIGIVGGASVYQWALDNGFLNELFVTVEPLVFGRGKMMFEGGIRTHRLALLSTKKLNANGTLLLRYKAR
jgi:dihydrofolate reductase